MPSARFERTIPAIERTQKSVLERTVTGIRFTFTYRINHSTSQGRAIDLALPTEPRFDPRPVNMGFVVDKVAMGQVFVLDLPCQYQSTNPPHSYFIHPPPTLRNISN